jgi:bifunctional DNA-binding transcriptional regulator/antitoxin component of YhaV-PrlF toxin-antitoxin module
MKKEKIYVKVDSRNRLTIPKEISHKKGKSSHLYTICEKDGKIILEPVKEIPERERWLFDPKNRAIVDRLKKAIKQKATHEIDLDALEKELNDI